jgi:Toastrack DUF4097
MKVNGMKTKLMTITFVTVLAVLAAPLAVEHLSHLKRFAEKWTKSNFLSGFVTVQASEKEDADNAPSTSLSIAKALQSSDEFHWNGRVSQGQVIEIKGINGDINAEPSTSGEVEVTAVKTGRRSNPKDVEIRVLPHGDGVTICAVYPSSNPNRPNGCEAGSNWSSHTRDNDVKVDFTVKVPQGVRFTGYTVNGNVETGALGSDVDASTVNGSIKVAAAGVAHARTVNGSINASLGSANWSGELNFETVNGGITLDLPSDTSTEVHAETLNGDIQTDFPITIMGSVSRRKLNGTIGGGGRELSLKTINGSIRLHRTS